MTTFSIEQLEQRLDNFDSAERRKAMDALMDKVHAGEIVLPAARYGCEPALSYFLFV